MCPRTVADGGMVGGRRFRAQHSIKSATFHLKNCATEREAIRVHRSHAWAYRKLKTKSDIDFANDPDLHLYRRWELRIRLLWDGTVRGRLSRHGCVVRLPPLPKRFEESGREDGEDEAVGTNGTTNAKGEGSVRSVRGAKGERSAKSARSVEGERSEKGEERRHLLESLAAEALLELTTRT